MKRTVALLGLSADPAHEGHLALSREVHALGYDEVWWSIAPANPFKPLGPRESYAHRHALARLLIEERAGAWLKLHDFEAALTVAMEEVRTYTYLDMLRGVYSAAYDFTFVMGSDNWRTFHTWGRFREILDHASVLVCNRGDDVARLGTCTAARELSARHDPSPQGPVRPGSWRIAPFEGSPASSTEIVAALRAGATEVAYLTKAQVAYIRTHGLYRPHDETRQPAL